MKRDIDVTQRNWSPSLLAGPICLVTTVNGDGKANVAPKSLVTFATVSPYRIAVGCNRNHHTAQNILRSGECVLNLPDERVVEKTWAAAEYMDPDPEEIEKRGFSRLPSTVVRPPRLAECRAHIECRFESVAWFGDECLLILSVVAASADEEVCDAHDSFAAWRPIFFLSPGRFGTIDATRVVG